MIIGCDTSNVAGHDSGNCLGLIFLEALVDAYYQAVRPHINSFHHGSGELQSVLKMDVGFFMGIISWCYLNTDIGSMSFRLSRKKVTVAHVVGPEEGSCWWLLYL